MSEGKVGLVERFTEAFKQGAGEPKNVLFDIDAKEMTGEVITLLDVRYGSAVNNGGCPCGSGEIYSKCCKPVLTMVQRNWRNRGKEERETRKAEHRQERDSAMTERVTFEVPRGTKWVCAVGFQATGQPSIVPVSQIAQKMGPYNVAGLLLNAYHMLMVETTGQMVTQVAEGAPAPAPEMIN